jgi:putative ABC transport system substrate-binding protein
MSAVLGSISRAGLAQPRRATVGFLSAASAPDERFRSNLLDQLQQRGWIEGSNLTLETRGILTGMTIPAAATELVVMKPDVLLTGGTAQVKMLRDLTKEIPIVMILAGDPVGSGLVQSLARPGGNVTGLSSGTDDLFPKVLSLLHELVPGARRIDVLNDAGHPTIANDTRVAGGIAQSRGFASQMLAVHSPDELEPTIAATRADALLVVSNAIFAPHLERMASAAIRRKLPTGITGGFGQLGAAAGLLFGYDRDRFELYRRVADYVDRILRGAKPAEMPIEQPLRYQYVINLKTARAIGLTVPKTHLLRADEVIE